MNDYRRGQRRHGIRAKPSGTAFGGPIQFLRSTYDAQGLPQKFGFGTAGSKAAATPGENRTLPSWFRRAKPNCAREQT